MPKFDCSGIEQIIAEMERLGENIGPLADDMLMEGADIIVDEWQESILRHDLVDTGQLFESITHGKPIRKGDVRKIDIYPEGYREVRAIGKYSDGHQEASWNLVPNAMIAFVNNYGAEGKDATHFIDEANERGSEKVVEKFQKKLSDCINRRKK